MAKRSVKRTRQQPPAARAATAASAPPAPPERRGSHKLFWLGVLVAAALLIPAGIVATVLAAGGGEETDPIAAEQAAVTESVQSEAEALREQTRVRDREQVGELTERVTGMQESFVPVLDGFAASFPPGSDRVGELATADEVAEWRGVVEEADAYFEDPPSGETGTNIARGAFNASVDTLLGATDTYALALDAEGGQREALLERAREQRDLAVRTWSVAATQLDAINISTGYGHQHVYLGGSEEAGGFGSDGAPEGSGAEPVPDGGR